MVRLGRRGRPAAPVKTAEKHRRTMAKLYPEITAGLGSDAEATIEQAAAALELLDDLDQLSELQIAMLIIGDYALYDVRVNGRSAVERYRDQRRAAGNERDDQLLAAMVAAHVSAYVVETVEPEVGCSVRDEFGGPGRFVVDPEVAGFASEGVAFVARLIEVDGVTFHSGPILPIDDVGIQKIRADLDQRDRADDPAGGDLASRTAAEVSAACWRNALASADRAVEAAMMTIMSEFGPTEDAPASASPRFWLPSEPAELLAPDRGGLTVPATDRRPDAHPTLVGPGGAPLPRSAPGALPIQRAKGPTGDHLNDVPQYQKIRTGLVSVQQKILDTLPLKDIQTAADNLGLLVDGVLVLDDEHEMSVISDHALYDIRRNGRTAIERYLEARGKKLSVEERALVDAMLAARYTIVMIEDRVAGAGVVVTDLLGGPPGFLYDLGLSQGAEPGLILATRLISPDGLTMTTGAALPVSQAATAEERERVIAAFADGSLEAWRNVSEGEGNSTMIRFGLERLSQATIVENDPTDPTGTRRGQRPRPGGRATGRPHRFPKPARPKKRRR